MLSSPQLISLKDKSYQAVQSLLPPGVFGNLIFSAVITIISTLLTNLRGKDVCLCWNTFIYKFFSTLLGDFQEVLLEKLRRIE